MLLIVYQLTGRN